MLTLNGDRTFPPTAPPIVTQLALDMLDVDHVRRVTSNVRRAIDAALANESIREHIAAGRFGWSADAVRKNPPVIFAFQHGELSTGLGEIVTATRYAGIRKLGELVEIRLLPSTYPVHMACITIRLYDHHPRRKKWLARAILKARLGRKYRRWVRSAMLFTQTRFVEEVHASRGTATRIRELTGLNTRAFWRRVRG